MDILAENNQIGSVLLKLLSRGHLVLAELLRLKDEIPSIYGRNPSRAENLSFGLLGRLDFTYFKNSDKTEELISKDDSLRDADESLKESYGEVLARFYRLFERGYRYSEDVGSLIANLETGAFLQQSLETLFSDPDGKQLLCEMLNLLGTILLLVDLYIPGPVRERLLVAYTRYSGQSAEHIDVVCKLFRSTGFLPDNKRPAHYPETYFERTRIPKSFVLMVINRLRHDDIYNQNPFFPERRSMGLAPQGSMMFVCLFFVPNNWVITYYMGTKVNLLDYWDPYSAAKSALTNTIQISTVKEMSLSRAESLGKVISATEDLLKDGVLTEVEILDKSVQTLNLLRECNYILRWIMLHTSPLALESNKRSRQYRDVVMNELQGRTYDVFTLLLNTSTFEYKVRHIHENMIAEREDKWHECKSECMSRMAELAEVFGGEMKLSRVSKSSSLQKWFTERKQQISELDLAQPLKAGRLAIMLIQALKESTELQHIESNLQVKQYVLDSVGYLHKMVRYSNVKDEFLASLQIIGDFQYAWEIIDNFTPIMQEEVKKNPVIVKRLRDTFIKLSFALEAPILRMSQAKSKDLALVSNYYSSEIVCYIRRVLQIIPESIFELIIKILYIQMNKIPEVPSRLEKDKVRDYSQLDERYEVAKLTHSISTYADGLLSMKSTLVGVINVDAKKLLNDGIRKELVQRISSSLHTILVFNSKSRSTQLFEKLKGLDEAMTHLRRSFEYVQDYINISGLKIWQEEMSRIINYNVEQEANLFLRHKVPQADSSYQSKAIPIPIHPPPTGDQQNLTFIGRLASEMLNVTDPCMTTFSDSLQAWYDAKTKVEVCSISKFKTLESAFGSYGMAGMDRLFGLKAVVSLQSMCSTLDKNVFKDKEWIALLDDCEEVMKTESSEQQFKTLKGFASKAHKSLGLFCHLVTSIGHYQLLRRQIAYRLKLMCNFDSKAFFSAVQNFNSAIIEDSRIKFENGVEEGNKETENRLLYELGNYLQWSGLTDPSMDIYVVKKAHTKLGEFIFLGIMASLSKLSFVDRVESPIVRKLADHIDGNTFAAGIFCLLHQHSKSLADKVVSYLEKYIACCIRATGSGSQDTVVARIFTDALLKEMRSWNIKKSYLILDKLL